MLGLLNPHFELAPWKPSATWTSSITFPYSLLCLNSSITLHLPFATFFESLYFRTWVYGMGDICYIYNKIIILFRIILLSSLLNPEGWISPKFFLFSLVLKHKETLDDLKRTNEFWTQHIPFPGTCALPTWKCFFWRNSSSRQGNNWEGNLGKILKLILLGLKKTLVMMIGYEPWYVPSKGQGTRVLRIAFLHG